MARVKKEDFRYYGKDHNARNRRTKGGGEH